ncbi:MAG: lysophospholipase [Hyphomicrobiales bacterium]|jgi:hypothetical protein|nr:lysophospholipase [Hyphomicrobiales bacterium]
MPLHLIKLSVGTDSIRDLEEWIAGRVAAKVKAGEKPEHTHRTRMVPKRVAELRDGGSMYWVIKGQISARQKIIDIRPFTDDQGISRCFIVMEPDLIPVMPRHCRPFQGWRYLLDHEKPGDVTAGFGELAEMPEELRRELRELGLL